MTLPPVQERRFLGICTYCKPSLYMLLSGMIVGFKHKGLKAFYETGKTRGIRADQARRIGIILAAIDEATSLDDLTRPSWRLHELIGDRKGIWSMTVNGPWRITFSYENGDFDILNLEQYHN